MAGTIVVDRIESDASYASNINVANKITFSNTSTFPAGTLGAPSITTAGDTNTGLYFPAADTIGFVEGGAEAGRFNSSGNLQIYNLGLGGTTPSTSGTGITFPASQSASTNANTLDDYEEGSWTPSLGGNTTYSLQEGNYTKIGNFVYVTGIIVVTSLGTGSTTTISGLPFTSFTQSQRHAGSIAFYTSIAVNTITLYCFNNNGSTTIQFSTVAVSTSGVDDTKAIFGNSAHVQFALSYRSA
jgi:hypothetical protein